MAAVVFDLNMSIDDVMKNRPATLHVLIGLRMHCVGCELASFHSVARAALEHGLDATRLLEQLNAAASEGKQ